MERTAKLFPLDSQALSNCILAQTMVTVQVGLHMRPETDPVITMTGFATIGPWMAISLAV